MVILGDLSRIIPGGAIRQAGHQEPLQGVFLASRDTHRSYRSEKRSYICTRLPMCAEGRLKSIAPPNGFRERSVMPASTLARGPMCCNILCREFWMSANQTVGVEYHA